MKAGVPGEDLAEDRAEGEDVGPLVDPVGLAAGLLGGHVGGRPHDRPGAGMVRVRSAPRRGDQRFLGRLLDGPSVIDGNAARLQDLGEAPVHHLDLAEAADHHVGRLQVAMDHAAGVGVGHRLSDGREDRQEPWQVVGRGRAGRVQLGQRPPSHQLHAEEGPAVGKGAQFVDRHDAGVLELAADLGLLDEAAGHVGVAAEVVAKDLDGDVAAEVVVVALEDGAHAAAADLAVDAVAGRGAVLGRDAVGQCDRLAGGRVLERGIHRRADRGGDGLRSPGGRRRLVGDGGPELAGTGQGLGGNAPAQEEPATRAYALGRIAHGRLALRAAMILAHWQPPRCKTRKARDTNAPGPTHDNAHTDSAADLLFY